MSRFHPASLVDPHIHPQELLDFFELDAQNRCIIEYIVYTTTDVATHAFGLDSTEQTRSRLLSASDERHRKYCTFYQFVSNVVRRSGVQTPTVLVALLYLRRVKAQIDVPPFDWILHRLFLGALILATKYTLDSPHRNRDWAEITGIFRSREIGRIEFDIFEILDMRLSFTEEELKQLRLEILAEYTTELAYLLRQEPRSAPPEPKNPRLRSPDTTGLPKRKKAKFIVEEDEDESDHESESGFESDHSYFKSELEDSYVYPSPPQLCRSASSSSSTSSVITPPEDRSVKLVRTRATADLHAGFNSRTSSYSPFSPTIQVPMVDAHTDMHFTKSSATGWQLFQWVRSSSLAALGR